MASGASVCVQHSHDIQFLYLTFCQLANVCPVPLSVDNACRYIAFLSHRLCFNSIKQYLNVVHIMHLEAGHSNPFHNSWHVDTLLKGTKRFCWASQKQKLPITPAILLQIFGLVDLSSSLDVTFWACCLVAFFSFSASLTCWLKAWHRLILAVTCVVKILCSRLMGYR